MKAIEILNNSVVNPFEVDTSNNWISVLFGICDIFNDSTVDLFETLLAVTPLSQIANNIK